MLAIRIAGREILGHPRDLSHAKGLYVRPGGMQGWEGISSTRREALARAVEHGEHDTPVYLGSRVVTIDGQVIAPTEDELVHFSDSVTGLFAAGRTRVSVQNRGRTLYADGRVTLAECEDLGSSGRRLRAEFQVQIVFADPRRYGEVNTLPGDRLNPRDPDAVAASIPVAHFGNFPAYPVIEIPNAPAAYTVASPAGSYAISGATAGGTHTVDLRRGRVFRNGVEMPGVGRGSLWTVPPGAAMVHTLSAPGRVRIPNTFV